ncbi:chaplin [Actinomadura rudentiformis]|uniref:chaplin n=1 Tax=Actinomadura rudentiformis TaxID=359158 RepID=UPI00178C6A0F|nr:chaplin [Actinomadura rudentiformis]
MTAGVAAGSSITGGATDADTTSGDVSVLGGNQINAPISVPINISGNSAALLGMAKAESLGGAHVAKMGDGGGSMKTSGSVSMGGGNQLRAPISIPIDFCGNALAIAGVAKAACKGTATVTHHGGAGPGDKTSGTVSVLGGNQAYVPIDIPLDVCGNAAAVLGVAKAFCRGGAHVLHGSHDPGEHDHHNGPPPPHECADRVSVRGRANPDCEGTKSAKPPLPVKTKAKTPKRPKFKKPKILPSTRRMAGTPEPVVEEPLPPMAQTLQDLIRAAGIPVPSPEHAAEYRPTLGVTKGLPVHVAGNPLLR